MAQWVKVPAIMSNEKKFNLQESADSSNLSLASTIKNKIKMKIINY